MCEPSRHWVVVERNGTVVWRGPVLTAVEDDAGTSPSMVEFGGEGLMAHLRKMIVTDDLAFTAGTDDQFDIARALVAHHQAKGGGDFGIDTSATTTSGRTRDRIYLAKERHNIYERVVELAEVDDGFDVAVNPATRKLDLFYPQRGRRRNDIVFDARNVRVFRRAIDGTEQASQVLGIGTGVGENNLTASRQDSTAVAAHGLTSMVFTNKAVRVRDTLQGHVDRVLATVRFPASTIGVTVGTADPALFSYEVGDEVRVEWPSPYRPVQAIRRLVGRDVIWTAGEEQAVLYLEEL